MKGMGGQVEERLDRCANKAQLQNDFNRFNGEGDDETSKDESWNILEVKLYLLRVPELVGLLKMDLLRSSMFVPKHMAAFCAACVYKDYLSHSNIQCVQFSFFVCFYFTKLSDKITIIK